MSLKHWKKLSEETLIENRWHEYKHDRVLIEERKEWEYFYIDAAPSSMIVPVLPDGRLVLVNQYRYLWNKESLEFPCGSCRYILPDGSKVISMPEEGAVRELKEETGYMGTISELGVYNPCNGFANEKAYVYLAKDLVAGEAQPETEEEFEIVLLTPTELEQKILSGEIWDGMTIVAWTLARPHILK